MKTSLLSQILLVVFFIIVKDVFQVTKAGFKHCTAEILNETLKTIVSTTIFYYQRDIKKTSRLYQALNTACCNTKMPNKLCLLVQ